MSNMSQDLNDSWERNVSYPCWPDEQPLQWTKILVLSTISILTLVFNSIILIAILSMKQKVVTRIWLGFAAPEKLHFRNSIEFHKCTFSLTAIWQVDGRQPPKVRNSSSSVRHKNQDAGISATKRATGNQLNFVSVLFHQPPFCQVDGRHSYSYCIGYWYRYLLSAISISRTTLR